VEELDDLLLAISHHLDQETSERKAIYYRLAAIESEMKGRSTRGFARYLFAICIGVAAIMAWQSYGEAARQIIATRAPELGWSPEASYSQRTEAIFFAFRLKAPGCFFWGCASGGRAAELFRISASARSQCCSASPPFAAQM